MHSSAKHNEDDRKADAAGHIAHPDWRNLEATLILKGILGKGIGRLKRREDAPPAGSVDFRAKNGNGAKYRVDKSAVQKGGFKIIGKTKISLMAEAAMPRRIYNTSAFDFRIS